MLKIVKMIIKSIKKRAEFILKTAVLPNLHKHFLIIYLGFLFLLDSFVSSSDKIDE